MQNKSYIHLVLKNALKLIVLSCYGFSPVSADSPKTYMKSPMAANASQYDDVLLGERYEKPVWNLHDALNLPDWLAVNIDQRTRYETLDGRFKAGNKGGDQQIPLQTDLWLQAKLNSFRFATEFTDARAIGADSGSGVTNNQANTADFVQAYVSWSDQHIDNTEVGTELKVGRQTIELGSRRLVARPLFRNTFASFTGLRWRLMDPDKWRFNGFVTMPVLRFPSSSTAILNDVQQFDQEATHTLFLGGFLEFFNMGWGLNSEVYLYHLDEADSFNNPTRKRRYFTPGLRVYIKPGKSLFDMQIEAMGQFGTVRANTSSSRNLQHEAWAEHITLGYTLDLPWSPRLAAEYDYATGNAKSGGDSDHRFDPLYGGSVQDFGPTGIYGPFSRSNISAPGYRLQLAPRSDVQFTFIHRWYWLASAGDCWGGATCTGSSLNLAPSKNSGSYIGNHLGFQLRYDFNSSLNLETGWFHLFKGQFAKQALNAPAGQDVDYFYVQSQLRF